MLYRVKNDPLHFRPGVRQPCWGQVVEGSGSPHGRFPQLPRHCGLTAETKCVPVNYAAVVDLACYCGWRASGNRSPTNQTCPKGSTNPPWRCGPQGMACTCIL